MDHCSPQTVCARHIHQGHYSACHHMFTKSPSCMQLALFSDTLSTQSDCKETLCNKNSDMKFRQKMTSRMIFHRDAERNWAAHRCSTKFDNRAGGWNVGRRQNRGKRQRKQRRKQLIYCIKCLQQACVNTGLHQGQFSLSRTFPY